jgi:hypothetical protein
MFKFITTIGFICCFSQIALSQQWLSGQWTGKGGEPDGSTWTMRVRAQKGRVRVEYPSLKCWGNWKLVSFNESRAHFREDIRFNRKACEPTGNVFIRRLRNNRILFTYRYNGEAKTGARAILRKRK